MPHSTVAYMVYWCKVGNISVIPTCTVSVISIVMVSHRSKEYIALALAAYI